MPIETSDTCPDILVMAPQYTHRSSGVRALYHLCRLLNRAGVKAAIAPMHPFDAQPSEGVPICADPPKGCVAIYPEIIDGNPLDARTVVRWALNVPGRLSGRIDFEPTDLMFVFEERMKPHVAEATGLPADQMGLLFVPIIDPRFIFPGDPAQRTWNMRFTHRGHDLRKKHKLPNDERIGDLEPRARSYWHLGEVLRKTKTIYSYEHASVLLKEAIISGCEVKVMHEDGVLRDPRTCGCLYNQDFTDGFETNYRAGFDDIVHVAELIARLDKLDSGWRDRGSAPDDHAERPLTRPSSQSKEQGRGIKESTPGPAD